ncbi:preprotein translocase subunit SecG [Sediminispirochaeta smaragdinae]|jgi:preprotein translocase subunit SecG|uniref:Protein-export membrane protein SecG n=1 Tax=Sediminispirochaeta smaragdinae (strain DSM 11293 / JCM 15392 / SEBR 4228) TaxID=573413 RepID=E1R3C5_SEDSS|nr:preprotein translocase, SecG subunit [Sediminispirochaeta smaragdinae DSM 11293]
MGFIGILLLVVFVISALLLIVIVMIQDDQGEGLGGIFGGSSSAFGSRSGNVLTKTTSILGTVFILCSFGLAWVNHTPEGGNVIKAARQEAGVQQEEWWNQQVETQEPNQAGTSNNAQ